MSTKPTSRPRKVLAVNKMQLRLLLGRADGAPLPATTWRRWYRNQRLPEQLNMTDTEFSRRQWFYQDHLSVLMRVIGFDENDLNELG